MKLPKSLYIHTHKLQTIVQLLLLQLSSVLATKHKSEVLEDTPKAIADGTQDLAAILAAWFVVDGVEQYSVDYSRGYLSVAAATCSMFGILGYVRALVKLGIGSKACKNSACSTGE